ncbi:hypothetical protein Bealeia1_01544 [Candidatus Bealeia paramacronuclearis]|uniref:Uncharacterized protein n=1 Tax=Candidatus Bealeia paramacronuclearis TaxID=1921001 RepID=A0ABZ2C4N0_9PROT|nr:hypothetical protein [Candidatus Bealeia paramacronuclearis]
MKQFSIFSIAAFLIFAMLAFDSKSCPPGVTCVTCPQGIWGGPCAGQAPAGCDDSNDCQDPTQACENYVKQTFNVTLCVGGCGGGTIPGPGCDVFCLPANQSCGFEMKNAKSYLHN